MAVPAYATDLTDITTDFSTNWNLISEGGGGQNSLTAPETDDLIQGTEAVSRNPFSTSIRGVAYDRATITVATDDAVFHWWKADVAAALDTFALGGVHLVQGSSLTVYKKFYVAGSDTYQLGGWRCTPIDPTASPSASRGTEPSPDFLVFGVAFDVPATGPSKGFPFKADMIRHGRQVEITAGEVANPASWTTLADYADVTSRRWGIVQGTDTGAALQGIAVWGTATTSVYSRDSNKTITLEDTLGFTTTDFTQILFSHASNDIEWDNVGLISLDSLNRGIIDVTANGTVTWTNSVFQDIDITNLLSNSTFDGSKWLSTNAVTAAGASMLNAKILTPTVAANTSALIWNVATDPNGLLDGMEFSMGSNDHHAIEFGTTSPLTMTLTGIDFSGFSGTDVNSSTVHVKRTSGTVTINLVGCTGTITARSDGATVVFVIDPVTMSVTVADANTAAFINGARVLVEVTSTAGGYPYLGACTVSVTTTVATVTHTAHGLSTNDWVHMRGMDQSGYNGIKQITKINDNSYSYTVVNDGAATGTSTSTFCPIFGTTNASGFISSTYSYTANQPVSGKIRSASGTPKYRNAPFTATIDSAAGVGVSTTMIPDG